MKIAYVMPRLHKHGGTEVGIAMLVEDLGRDHDITVFASQVADLDATRFRWMRVPTVQRPGIARYLSFLLTNTLMLRTLRRQGHEWDVIHTSGADTALAQVYTCQYCQAERLRLVRAGVIRHPTATLGQRLRRANALAFYRLTAAMERRIYGGIQRQLICVSPGIRQDIRRHYRPSGKRMTVVPNAVDQERFHPRLRAESRPALLNHLGLSDSSVLLLFVGAEWERKGLDVAIETLAALPADAQRQAHLVVVGRGDIPHYRSSADRLGVSDRVHFLGQVQAPERYFAASDIFVFPSRYEAFSLATLEAAASGLPLAVTRINGTEDLVEDGENGHFIPGEGSGAAELLAPLIVDTRRRQEMRAAARASVARFSREHVASATLDVYDRVISRAGVP